MKRISVFLYQATDAGEVVQTNVESYGDDHQEDERFAHDMNSWNWWQLPQYLFSTSFRLKLRLLQRGQTIDSGSPPTMNLCSQGPRASTWTWNAQSIQPCSQAALQLRTKQLTPQPP
jgi:hypothetical protein